MCKDHTLSGIHDVAHNKICSSPCDQAEERCEVTHLCSEHPRQGYVQLKRACFGLNSVCVVISLFYLYTFYMVELLPFLLM